MHMSEHISAHIHVATLIRSQQRSVCMAVREFPVGGNEKDASDTDTESEDDGADIADLAEGELTSPVRLM